MLNIFAKYTDPDSGERLLNLFLRGTPNLAAAQILGRSGLVAEQAMGREPRCHAIHRGEIYTAANGRLWRKREGVWSSIATLPDGETRMASGSTQIGIVANGSYYVFNSTGDTIEKVTPGALTWPVDVAHLAGFFVVFGSHSGRLDGYVYSALDDATTFDGLDFAFAEGSEDAVVGCIVDHLFLWVFGKQSIELRYVAGSGLTPDQTGYLEHGCCNRRTIAKADNRVFWIGNDGVPYVGSRGSASVLSQRWVDEGLSLDIDAIDCAFMVRDRGHLFYAIRLTDKPALVFDVTTGLWHERNTGLDEGPWAATSAIMHNGAQYVGTTTGKVCALGGYEDDGEPFGAEATSPPMTDGTRRTASLLSITTGGGQEDIGRVPQAILRTRRDGRDWGYEKFAPLPKLGQHRRPTTWRALGQARTWQFQVRITDPVNRDILGALDG